MKNISTKIIAVSFLTMALTLPMFADQEVLKVDSFSGVEIGTGMLGNIKCGSENSVTLHGDAKSLSNVDVTVHAGKLDISRHSSAGKMLSNIFGNGNTDNTIKADIVTIGPLNNLSGSTGSELGVPACAIDTTSLEVEAGTGATIDVEGSTETLELDLSTGSIFNRRSAGFTVVTANVDLSTGAEADLCGATTINGDASTGATIRANDSADTENVSLSTGAEVYRRCK